MLKSEANANGLLQIPVKVVRLEERILVGISINADMYTGINTRVNGINVA
jgi:hypothetical protein